MINWSTVPVLTIVDVGPWYDGREGWPEDPYWIEGKRPRAEGVMENNSGLDLTPGAFDDLGVPWTPGGTNRKTQKEYGGSGDGIFDWRFSE